MPSIDGKLKVLQLTMTIDICFGNVTAALDPTSDNVPVIVPPPAPAPGFTIMRAPPQSSAERQVLHVEGVGILWPDAQLFPADRKRVLCVSA